LELKRANEILEGVLPLRMGRDDEERGENKQSRWEKEKKKLPRPKKRGGGEVTAGEYSIQDANLIQ